MKIEILTDPVAIDAWIDSWKDETTYAYISKDDEWKNVPRLNGSCTINSDGTVDVEGGVYLQGKVFEAIPIQFGIVAEDFDCYDNPNLTTLQGCPSSVGGSFDCSDNSSLTSLEYSPSSVGGSFDCFDNPNLTTLQGAPNYVGGMFYCSDNPKLITNAHNSKIVGEFYPSEIQGTVEERTERYMNYLNSVCPDVRASILWLREVDCDLYNQMAPALIEYSLNNNIDLGLSDDVKNIANVALNANHRL